MNSAHLIKNAALVVAFFLFTSVASALEFDIFNVSQRDYDVTIQLLRTGDYLILPGFGQVQIQEILNKGDKGSTTFIAKTDLPGKVLRLPLSTHSFPFINLFWKAQKTLAFANIPGVKVFEEESQKGKYMFVEEVKIVHRLSEFYLDQGLKSYNLSKAEINILGEKFARFMAKTARFRRIGDLRAENVVYDGLNWRILDVTNTFYGFHDLTDSVAMSYDSFRRLPNSWQRWSLDAVKTERKEILENRCWRIASLWNFDLHLKRLAASFL